MLIVFYIVYAMLSAHFSMIVTEKVYSSRVAESIDASCLVLRQEQPIASSDSGFVSYTVNDGEKVNSTSVVAKVFSSQTATTTGLESEREKNELASLKKLNDGLKRISVGINVVESQITTSLCNYNTAVINGDYSELFDLRNNIMYYINERKYLTGEVKNFDDRVNYLKDKLSSYSSGAAGNYAEIPVGKSGIFSSYCDGYEDCFDYKSIEKMTIDDYQTISKKTVAKNTIGKVITEFEWYVVCPVTSQEALRLNSSSGKVYITFTSSSFDKVPAQLVKINQKNKNTNGLAVFKCSEINSHLVNLRNEDIRIDINYYEGLRIPKKAIRTAEVEVKTTDSEGNEYKKMQKVQGVYIKYAKELMFREISIIYSSSNYVICDANPEQILTEYGTIRLYDDVVTQGADLYDGKIVN
ncbi:MAG: hypothetical protein K6F76_01975 [Clostridiales bacterium]|nr:hypothetical protein [Clostridiales bacterium]